MLVVAGIVVVTRPGVVVDEAALALLAAAAFIQAATVAADCSFFFDEHPITSPSIRTVSSSTPTTRLTGSKVAAPRPPRPAARRHFLAYLWRSSTNRASGTSRCTPSGSGTSTGVAPTSNPNTPFRTNSRPTAVA